MVISQQGWIDNFNGPSGLFIAVSNSSRLFSLKTLNYLILKTELI